MVADVTQGVNQWWAPALAFAAGVVSFLSPCVLPLVPGYLAMVTGGDDPTRTRRPLLPVLLFILGFSVVFTVVGGFAATALTRAVKSAIGQRIAGVPLGRDRQSGQALRPSHRDRHGHASVLERERGIGPEAGVGLPFVLDLQAAAKAVGHGMAPWNRKPARTVFAFPPAPTIPAIEPRARLWRNGTTA